MNKTYQPQIIEISEDIVESLTSSGFFIENEIEDNSPALNVVCDILTEKFIKGDISDGMVDFTDEEFESLLRMIKAVCLLKSLKKKGLADSYEDENTEEVFFLTKDGKAFGEWLTGKT